VGIPSFKISLLLLDRVGAVEEEEERLEDIRLRDRILSSYCRRLIRSPKEDISLVIFVYLLIFLSVWCRLMLIEAVVFT